MTTNSKREFPTPKEYVQLEQLIDTYGLKNLLIALADICSEKAQHVQENWGDRQLKKNWDKADDLLNRAAQRMPELP